MAFASKLGSVRVHLAQSQRKRSLAGGEGGTQPIRTVSVGVGGMAVEKGKVARRPRAGSRIWGICILLKDPLRG